MRRVGRYTIYDGMMAAAETWLHVRMYRPTAMTDLRIQSGLIDISRPCLQQPL